MEYLEGYGEDIIGEDELVGDVVDEILEDLSGEYDEDEDVGAVKRRLKAKIKKTFVPKIHKAIRKIRASQFRNYPIGLGINTIGAGLTVTIVLNPQLPFKPSRLSTPAPAGLYIQDIQVGTASQFAGPGAIPVACFGPTATDSRLKGDTAVPGVQIQIQVQNTTAGPLVMDGMLIGDVAQ